MKNKKSEKTFILSVLVINIFLILSVFLSQKGTFLLWLNKYQSLPSDLFFNGITYVGDGILIIGISAILLLLKKYKIALWNFITYLFSGILVQIPKHLVNAPRPKAFLENFAELSMPIWVNIKTQNSFPSGHTTSAFAMLVFFGLLTENTILRYVLFTIACLVALSRVYLLQHFLIDVTTGAFIGSFSAWVVYEIAKKKGLLL